MITTVTMVTQNQSLQQYINFDQFEKWVGLYPYFNDTVTPDQYEKWTLVVSARGVAG